MAFHIWSNYKETEIQAIVSRLFKKRGYTVRHQHLVDRSKEKGADLIASKTGEAGRIAIQVKKKPSSSDLTQLHDLAERPEETKKYVYIEEPSTDFFNEMKTYSNRIDFWNGETLLKEILHDDPCLALLLLVSNTQMARYLWRIQCLLFDCRDRTENKSLESIELPNPTKEMLQLLWQAKDRACAVGKGLLLFGSMFDQSDRESSALMTKDIEYTTGSFVRTIDYSCLPEVEQLHDFFVKMDEHYREYLEYASIERRIGTEWMYLMQLRFLRPGNVESMFKMWASDEEKLEPSLKQLSISNLRRDTVFSAISDLSKEIAQLGMGIEGIIDDVWRYALQRVSIRWRSAR